MSYFHDKVINTYNEVTYERAKGPKILSRIPIATANLQFDVDRSIWENFDIVFAIDTNTRPIKDRSVSVSGIIACQKIIAVSPDAVAEEVWRYTTPFCMEFMDVEAKPENLGWAMLVEHVETSDEYKRFNRVGLIVDSDLDSLKGYNAGEAIYGSLFLPPRIKLIYASCDSGGEFFATQMLRFADSVASRCLDELEAGRVALNTKTIEGAPYKSYRHLVSAYHW